MAMILNCRSANRERRATRVLDRRGQPTEHQLPSGREPAAQLDQLAAGQRG